MKDLFPHLPETVQIATDVTNLLRWFPYAVVIQSYETEAVAQTAEFSGMLAWLHANAGEELLEDNGVTATWAGEYGICFFKDECLAAKFKILYG